jgi:uncharacterized protein YrrD
MRTSQITKRPVVTMGGDDVGQIKDVIYSAGGGAVAGFTLAGRKLLSGPLKESLPWTSVSALGADAVMIQDVGVLKDKQDVLQASAATGGSGGDVLGSQVLTDAGVDLGKVVDVIVDVGSETCDVVGYEIEAAEGLGTNETRVLIPLPDTLAASGQHLILPASAQDFVGQDLAGFGASVEAFRAQLEGRS